MLAERVGARREVGHDYSYIRNPGAVVLKPSGCVLSRGIGETSVYTFLTSF